MSARTIRGLRRRLNFAFLTAGVAIGVAALGGATTAEWVVFYLLGVLLPGGLLYLALAVRFPSRPRGVIESFFFANVIGLTLVEGAGWLLAEVGHYSLGGTIALSAAPVVGAIAYTWAPFRTSLKEGFQGLVAFSRKEAGYLCVVAGLSGLLTAPLFWLPLQGLVTGGDTAIFTEVGHLISTTGTWPVLSQVWYPYASAAGMAPGVPVLYAIMASVTGTLPILVANPLALLPIVLDTLGAYVLVRRFARHSLVVYFLPIIWLVSPWRSGSLLYNSLLPEALYAISPDFLFGVAPFLAVLVLLVDLLNGKNSQWFEVSLLVLSFYLAVLDNQLFFLFLIPTILLFFLESLFVRGIRWSCTRFPTPLLPVILFSPPYLEIRNAVQASPVLSGGHGGQLSALLAIDWPEVQGLLNPLDGAVLALLGLVLALEVSRRLRRRRRTEERLETRGLGIMFVLVLFGSFLSYTNVGPSLLGINYSRFLFFVTLPLIPLLAYGLDWMIDLARLSRDPGLPSSDPSPPRLATSWRRLRNHDLVRRGIPAICAGALLISTSVFGFSSAIGMTESATNPQNLFTPDMYAASQWLRIHALPGTVVAADEMAGNAGLEVMRDYIGHILVTRPRYDLYIVIYGTPAPANLSYYYENLVMTDPSFVNARAASQQLSMDYYVFQKGYSNAEITAFSLLPYFSEVYSNPQIAIFEFTGGPQVGFLPAVDYCSISPSLQAIYFSRAYSTPFGLPRVPNAISSEGLGVIGANVTYCVNSPTPRSYVLYVHRYTFQTSEYLRVLVDGQFAGSIHFSQTGPNIGSPLPISLPAGPSDVTLTVEGTVAYVDPIDYVVFGVG